MKLILLTTPTFFVEEPVILNALFAEGLDVLHLRKPGGEPLFCERLLRLIDRQWHKQIVVHDQFYLQSEFHLKGIHLNSRNPTPPTNFQGSISRSCHTLAEVSEWKQKCNYVFLSPIFDSISKKGYSAAFTPQALEMAADDGTIDKRVVALGGIEPSNISLTRAYGFGGIAILGGLWRHFDFHASSSFHDIIGKFKQMRKLSE